MRRFLDRLYFFSGAFAALCLAAVCVMMLAQAAGREAGILIRGAEDITAWLTAASAFFALGHTFRNGELVRVGLWLDMLGARNRWLAEIFSLGVTVLFSGYMLWSVARFVYESWRFNEVAQGLLRVPIWIPQMSLVIGVLIFLVTVIDEMVVVLQKKKPAYQVAEEARRAAGDFSETV